MKQGDLEPPFTATVRAASDTDLNNVVSWNVIGWQKGETVFSRQGSATVSSDGTTADVTYEWQEGDTNTVGMLYLDIQAVWPDGRIQTFPGSSYRRVEIVPNLEATT